MTRIETLEAVLKALADKTRLRILGLLLAGEICVCHIHESLGITQSKASRHLAYLRKVGLVEDRKKGLWVYYRLAPQSDPALRKLLASAARYLAELPDADADLQRLSTRTGCCRPAARPEVWLTPPET
jgi:ArsR family transcriptional regulator, arsenate/arsenite/antimonite-responsive transcriptional repressor